MGLLSRIPMFTTGEFSWHRLSMMVIAALWNGVVAYTMLEAVKTMSHGTALWYWDNRQCIVEQVHDRITIGCWGGCAGPVSYASRKKQWHDEPHELVHA